MTRILLRPVTQGVDKLLAKALKNAGATVNQGIPRSVLIVGPPRSGSTVLYQVLTRVIPCAYTSNMHSLFPDCASHIMNKRGMYGSATSLRNYFGYTSQLADVNEANDAFAELFVGNPSSEILRQRMIQLAHRLGASELRPMLLKNIRFHEMTGILHEAIPELKILRVVRNREQVVQSELRAFHRLGYFHPIPDSMKDMDFSDPVAFAVKQIAEIELTIDRQLADIDPSSWDSCSYEEFCLDPAKAVEDIATRLLGVSPNSLRLDLIPRTLKASFTRKVSSAEADRIQQLMRSAL
jgi:hypothetical protein